jgi:hypothetical protein
MILTLYEILSGDLMMSSISGLVTRVIKTSAIIAITTASILYLFWGASIFFGFSIGAVLGCINFLFLTYGTSYMFSKKPKNAAVIHMGVFILRFGLIGFVFYISARSGHVNIFVLVLGFLVVYLSIVIAGLSESRGVRRDKKDGRS